MPEGFATGAQTPAPYVVQVYVGLPDGLCSVWSWETVVYQLGPFDAWVVSADNALVSSGQISQ